MNIQDMKEITIYTDGACQPNPGKGGWAAVLIWGDYKKEISGFKQYTTNQEMELFAVISALKMLKERCRVKLYTDSGYVSNSINKSWVFAWRRNGWTNSGGEVKHKELWEELLELLSKHIVEIIWVKGHANNLYNNRCDELAVAAIKNN